MFLERLSYTAVSGKVVIYSCFWEGCHIQLFMERLSYTAVSGKVVIYSCFWKGCHIHYLWKRCLIQLFRERLSYKTVSGKVVIQLFQLTLSEEKQKVYKPRPQGNMAFL